MIFIGLMLVLGFAALVGLVVMLTRSNDAPDAKAPAERGAIDAWVEEAVAREVAKRTGLARDAALSALRGDPDPEAVTTIEGAIRKVSLKYERLPHEGRFEVRAEIAFEDGTTETGVESFAHADLPQAVKDELARTGASFVFREWQFAWSVGRGWA